MIGITEDNAGIKFFKQMLRNSFYRTDSPHRHKDRRFDGSVGQRHGGAATFAACLMDLEF
jgi:hypothetical protein